MGKKAPHFMGKCDHYNEKYLFPSQEVNIVNYKAEKNGLSKLE
ncbi:hypothetical protein [Avibacterium endocarditidis]|nr:hypothetical protein [Avibacterium endocarditidis]